MGITRDLVEYDRNIQYVPFKVPKTGVLDTDDWGGVDYNDPDAIGANPVAKIYPDGTIVGSTDNGDYVKYANGELECLCSGDPVNTRNAIDGLYRSDEVLIQYPILFTEGHAYSCSSSSTGRWIALSRGSLSGCSYRVYNSSDSSSFISGEILAKGKWK